MKYFFNTLMVFRIFKIMKNKNNIFAILEKIENNKIKKK